MIAHRFVNLETLQLRGTTDNSCDELIRLRGLSSFTILGLICEGKKATDEVAASLGFLEALRGLHLCKCRSVTDVGLSRLMTLKLPHKDQIVIMLENDSNVAGLTTLRDLNLMGCASITDADAEDLAALTLLTALTLATPSRITDCGVHYVLQ